MSAVNKNRCKTGFAELKPAQQARYLQDMAGRIDSSICMKSSLVADLPQYLIEREKCKAAAMRRIKALCRAFDDYFDKRVRGERLLFIEELCTLCSKSGYTSVLYETKGKSGFIISFTKSNAYGKRRGEGPLWKTGDKASDDAGSFREKKLKTDPAVMRGNGLTSKIYKYGKSQKGL